MNEWHIENARKVSALLDMVKHHLQLEADAEKLLAERKKLRVQAVRELGMAFRVIAGLSEDDFYSVCREVELRPEEVRTYVTDNGHGMHSLDYE